MLEENEFIKLINKDEEIEEEENDVERINEGVYFALKYVRKVLREEHGIENRFVIEKSKRRKFF